MTVFFYILLEVVIPLAMVVLIYWPGGQTLLLGEPHLYYKIFSSGDLIGMCVAIALSTYVHLDQSPVKSWTSAGKAILFAGGLIMMFMYACIKIVVMKYNFPDATGTVSENIQDYALWNFCTIAVTAMVGIAARVMTRQGYE